MAGFNQNAEFWGGPLDGKPVGVLAVADWLAFKIAHANGSTITYNYIYNDKTNKFEHVGEDDDE